MSLSRFFVKNYFWFCSIGIHSTLFAVLGFLPAAGTSEGLPGSGNPQNRYREKPLDASCIRAFSQPAGYAFNQIDDYMVSFEGLVPSSSADSVDYEFVSEERGEGLNISRSPARIVPDAIFVRDVYQPCYTHLKDWQERLFDSKAEISRQTEAYPRPGSLRNRLPSYPLAARNKGQEGLVVLRVEILETGRPGRIEVEISSGYSILDKAAVKGVRKWLFTPATKDGTVVITVLKIPIRFRLL